MLLLSLLLLWHYAFVTVSKLVLLTWLLGVILVVVASLLWLLLSHVLSLWSLLVCYCRGYCCIVVACNCDWHLCWYCCLLVDCYYKVSWLLLALSWSFRYCYYFAILIIVVVISGSLLFSLLLLWFRVCYYHYYHFAIIVILLLLFRYCYYHCYCDCCCHCYCCCRCCCWWSFFQGGRGPRTASNAGRGSPTYTDLNITKWINVLIQSIKSISAYYCLSFKMLSIMNAWLTTWFGTNGF